MRVPGHCHVFHCVFKQDKPTRNFICKCGEVKTDAANIRVPTRTTPQERALSKKWTELYESLTKEGIGR
mgnify:FL=1